MNKMSTEAASESAIKTHLIVDGYKAISLSAYDHATALFPEIPNDPMQLRWGAPLIPPKQRC